VRALPTLLLTLILGCGADPGAPAIPPANDAGATLDGEAPAPDAPSRDWGPPVDPMISVPAFDAATVARVRALRAMGAARGMRPDVIAKIGDSITESASFLSDIGHGWHELGAHGYLQPTVTYFSRVRFADGTNSLNRASSCAMGGWVAAYALSMDPMSALRNEMDYTRPAYAIVMYGTNDLDRIAPQEFTGDMTRILDIIESYGSVPIMSTIPDRLDRAEAGARVPAFNEAIRAMADRERETWAHSEWLSGDSTFAGSPAEVAVPVVNAVGMPLAALVADLPVGASTAGVATAAAHLTRAVNAAVRTLGHG
jgi:lysophospholipase L1-like esterase